MTRKLWALAAFTVAFGVAPAFAQTRTYWPPGLEQQEREITRQLNNEHGVQFGEPSYYQPQYSYVPPPRPYQPYPPQYSYAPAPAYAYPYDYPPRPYYSRYY
jgi:hypothetical protein